MHPPASTPLVSVVVAAHDAAAFVGEAVQSVLRQTIDDLELIVVDDGSVDTTPDLLAAIGDRRLHVLRNEQRLGLAASLNRALDTARGRYVARLDADDVALPLRLARQLAALDRNPGLAILGTAVLEIDDGGKPGVVHRAPHGTGAVRWHALFGTPFFHPTVIVDRALLERHGLRYDESLPETEDYDLWTRLLEHGEGDNLDGALVLRRVHASQATRRRRGLQREYLHRVALREIGRTAPGLGEDASRLVLALGAGEELASDRAGEAVDAFVSLLAAFGRRHGPAAERAARRLASRQLARGAMSIDGSARAALARAALRLDPTLPLRVGRARLARTREWRSVRPQAESWLRELCVSADQRPTRVTLVSPEPTPYRSPLLDRVADRPEVELTVLYAGRTVAGRTWDVQPRHRAVFLRGLRVPGVRRLLRHDYPVTPGVVRALRESRPEVVVVNGWSTFAAQAAIVWCRRRRLPYLLLVSSHDAAARSAWRRAARTPIVPRVVRSAWGALALGTLSRASLVANGARPERVGLFANTVDVAAWGERADRLAGQRPELRASFGIQPGDVAVLCVARLAPEKGLETLLRAAAAVQDPSLVVALAGDGPERERLRRLAGELQVRLVLTGDLPWERIAEVYAAADVFALLSSWEPWAVVVNEAAASGLPLVLSDQVGAAPDLLVDGDNGALVKVGDVQAAAAALRQFALDPVARLAAGARSREIVQGWGYEPSVASFVATVREAAGDNHAG